MNKADKENREKQEKFQVILSGLLRDDDNKYCVDCDAKGPRWASWNLGVFLCIRCAGIHRNLGVHISKVKSVTLDAWGAEQVAMMQDMGNSRARAVYEANIPDNFRRPQTDSALEAFIRAKYEQKKYIASEWVPPKPRSVVLPPEELSRDKKVRPRANPAPTVVSQKVAADTQTKVEGPAAQPANKPTAQAASKEIDLLGLDAPVVNHSLGGSDDLFTDFMSSTTVPQPSGTSVQNNGTTVLQNNGTVPQNGGAFAELSDAGLFGSAGSVSETNKTSAKDAIMALYGPSTGGGFMMGGGNNGMMQAGPPMQPMMMVGGMPQYMGAAPNMMGANAGMMGAAPNMMQQQYMGANPNVMGANPAMMGANPAMLGANMMGANVMGSNPAMMGVPQYNNMLPQQQQHMYNMHQVQHQMGTMSMGGGPASYNPTPTVTNMWQ